MEFIEIAEGLSIRIDEIEAIGKRDEYLSTVYTHHNDYESTFPYNVLLDLLETQKEKDEKKVSTPALNILKTQGYFAG